MTPQQQRENFSRRDVALASGATERQIQLWHEAGLLPIRAASGRHQAFTPDDVILARFIARLRRAFITPAKILELMRDPGARRIIAAAKRRSWGAYILPEYSVNPRMRIFATIADLVHWLKDFDGAIIAVDLWELGPHSEDMVAQPLHLDPAFDDDGPTFGAIQITGLEQASLIDVGRDHSAE